MTRSQAAGSFVDIFQVNIIYFASTNEAGIFPNLYMWSMGSKLQLVKEKNNVSKMNAKLPSPSKHYLQDVSTALEAS